MQNTGQEPSERTGTTAGVALLTGDPKRAILKLSIPMIAAMLLMSTYNLVDAIWVAGLGSDALAAVGFMTPVFMILMGLSVGLGAGVTSAIARRIGAGNREGADNTAVHAILLSLTLSAALTLPLILLAGPVAVLLGAGDTTGLATVYGQTLFTGTVFVLFTNIAYAILRAEGDMKRTMYAMGASSIINIVLDPILIYGAGMGIAGAALATVISIALVSVVILFWFFVRKDTYVSLSRRVFSPDPSTIIDILKVGLPASLEFFLMSALAIIINSLLVGISGTDAVAIYTTGWRVVMFAIIPFVGISTAVVSVGGAAYGARKYEHLKTAHTFSVGLGVVIAIAMSAITWLVAPQIALIFTYSPESAHLAPGIVVFLQIMCFFYPFVPPGIMSGSIFQGTGKGTTSLAISVLRNLLFIALFTWVLAIPMGMGEAGVWWGIVAGDILGGIVGYLWARLYIARLIATAKSPHTP
ncbi:MATE efflux family protein [Methanofollis liminatans DSM 4140]|jgi:putative MATE family efflux protein|uniref:MATE efflux family protein n=1 Tax=Methanofollis liminatans DSM 4140 TaxID=28892 RepID=J0RYL6_9EURY|nr:MATE family efflux transporter [Methanofollis liminatans]EJG06646.1 MATE efflux family protein [Methanofollis liminatans DSM 4140]